MSNVLTNNTTGSIILALNTNSPGSTISIAPGASLLYSDVVITDEANPNYNVPLIQEYINSGILLNQNLSGLTGSELQLLSPANLVINMTTGTPQLLSKSVPTNIDNQQVLASNDMDGKLQYIYYKSVQGMSLSMDFGATQFLIDNTNLLYPDEITSFAVQVYDSINGILKQVNRLYIGTLREGVKTYTPGIDTTYVDFDPTNTAFDAVSPLFKNVLTTVIETVSGPTYIGGPNVITVNSTDTQFTTFCPTYILGIINTPYTSGCPIFVATRTIQTTITNSFDTTVSITNPPLTVTTNNVYETKVAFKYLHQQIYVNNTLTNTIPTINQPVYFNTANNWILLQQSSNFTADVNIPNIIDIENVFPTNIVDVITEYIPTGMLVLTKYPSVEGGPSNALYFITCFNNITNIPIISSLELPSELKNIKLKNMSYLSEIDGINYDIFITTDTEVWRYSSNTSVWEQFLYFGNAINYLNTAVSNGILSSDGIVGLQELSNFIMLPKINTTNAYVGILGSELGLTFFNLKLVNNEFITNAKNTVNKSINVSGSAIITDIKFNTHGENMYVFTCSYSSQIPRTWFNNSSCLQLIDNSSKLISNVYYLKPDIEANGDSPYYVTQNSLQLNYQPSGEQASYTPVLIYSDYEYNLQSAKYSFKLSNFVNDTILCNELTSTLAYKYYVPYITERIISSISPAELNILELNEYKHAFSIPSINSISIFSTLGTQVSVSEIQSVVLPDTYTYNGSDYMYFVCTDLTNSVVIPTSIITQEVSGQFSTTITFENSFSGSIYFNACQAPSEVSFSGLFGIIAHNFGTYPQVILDSSSAAVLNDIKYIDINRLELSFKSSVNTTVLLAGQPVLE